MRGWTRANWPGQRARELKEVELSAHQREVVLDMLEILEGKQRIVYIGGRGSGRSTIMETVREIDRLGLGPQILHEERPDWDSRVPS